MRCITPHSQNMEIQSLAPEEVARFRAIRLRALREAPGAFGTRFEDALGWSHGTWSELFAGLHAFVAVARGKDVGMVRSAPDLQVSTAARLGSLWVAPEARGTGVGSALVDTVLAWARDRGFTEVLLDVSDDNAFAIALYDRMGFEPTGVVSAFPPPREHLGKHQRRLAL
jgi:ribosomal protein S18 acetylase RimI-like enzyme